MTSLGNTTATTRDLIGRATLVVGPDSIMTRTWYDAMDRPDSTRTWGPARNVGWQTAPADSVQVNYLYDANGNTTHATRVYRKDGVTYSPQARWGYDAADRVVWHKPEDLFQDEFVLDSAGNVRQRITARGHTIAMTYDALNRVVRRVVPGITYGSSYCWSNGFSANLGTPCNYTFPTVGSSVVIPADTARFDFDAMGNLTRAYNGAARIRRSYTPAGRLATDTLQTRTYDGADLMGGWYNDTYYGHPYGLRLSYDLDGRRVGLRYSSQLLPGSYTTDTQNYTYSTDSSTATGELTDVTDLHGRTFTLDHDANGRHWRTQYPNGLADTTVFDHDGRVVERGTPGIGWETITRDAAGRATTVVADTGTIQIRYTGLGAVAQASGIGLSSLGTAIVERFDVDAIGNRVRQRALYAGAPSSPDEHRQRLLTYDGTGRLLRVGYDSVASGCSGCGFQSEMHYEYDDAGNREAEWGNYGAGSTMVWDQTRSYYGADGLLRVTNRHVGLSGFGNSDEGGVFEEYRYDALGRRVLVRSRATSGCFTTTSSPCPKSYTERTVWDGDQVLAEIRAPGDTVVAASVRESDSPSWTSLNAGYHFGRVVYTHALGLDAPLAVTREGLAAGTTTVFPHANWRGEFADGSLPGSATPLSQCTASCPVISWPGRQQAVDGGPVPDKPAPVSWWGGLLQRKTDGSGLQYMRNRYYDPKTGRFTQVDPIGLAGGMNLYGFAEGDPVNHSDPFGLCPPEDTDFGPECPGYFTSLFTAAGGMLGAGLGGTAGGAGGTAVCSPGGPVAIACGGAGAVGGAALGAAKGAAAGAVAGGLLDGAVMLAKKVDIRQVDQAIRQALGRKPSDEERGEFRDQIHQQKKGGKDYKYQDLVRIAKELFGIDP